MKRERIDGNSHLKIKGARKTSVGGTLSLSVGGLQIKVGKDHALEAAERSTSRPAPPSSSSRPKISPSKGPRLIRIDAAGVTIVGNLVKINSGGSAGTGADASPAGPEDPDEALIDTPQKPAPDDVEKTRLGQ
ncbi:MAG: hypothetical protein R3F14_40440 [Polyangiaceae bacterium]